MVKRIEVIEEERGHPRIQVIYWLKTTRAVLGWTQKEVAAYLGVTTQTVRGWERGKRSMPAETLIALVRLRKNFERAMRRGRGMGPAVVSEMPANWRRQKDVIMSL